MCGIFGFLGNTTDENVLDREHFLELSKRIRHRGPDWNGIYTDNIHKVVIAHERLSIVGVSHGSQPIIDNDEFILSVNGEIYNYKELYKTVLHNKYVPNTRSDCEVIIHLYKEFGPNCVKMLDGIFGFILYDKINSKLLVARDPIGIIPLYYGILSDNKGTMIASEMKSLIDDCEDIQLFPPGHYLNIDKVGKIKINLKNEYDFIKYFNPKWDTNTCSITYNIDSLLEKIRTRLTESVDKRLMTDVPFGVLLSGGLDSSLIAAIANRQIKSKPSLWGEKLHSFSIGLKDAPDLKYAKIVADYLGTIHHELILLSKKV